VGEEMTLAFEETATETQKRIIVGVAAFIVSVIFENFIGIGNNFFLMNFMW